MRNKTEQTSTLDSNHVGTSHPAFLLLNLSYFLVFSNVALFYLYPLALDRMGAGSREIGWVMGLFSLAAVVSRPLIGAVGARRGDFWVMLWGTAGMLLASCCYPFLSGVGAPMLLVRVFHGLGFSGFIAGSFSAVARLFPDEGRARAYSMVGASLMGAVALAPLLGELLIKAWGFEAVFAAACGVTALSWGVVRQAGRITGMPAVVNRGGRARYRPFLSDPSFLFLLLSTLIFAHCQSTVFNFLALAAERREASAGPFFFAAFALAIGILLGMGGVVDRRGKLRFMRFFYPPFALGIFLVPYLLGGPGGLGAAVLFGAGIGFLFPTHNALAGGYGAAGDKATVMAVFTAVYDSGFISGPVVSGWIASRVGLDGLFHITGLLAAAGFVVSLISSPGRG
ncbi:MAG: MFS transporter [Desulfobacteraceae bacterium]